MHLDWQILSLDVVTRVLWIRVGDQVSSLDQIFILFCYQLRQEIGHPRLLLEQLSIDFEETDANRVHAINKSVMVD